MAQRTHTHTHCAADDDIRKHDTKVDARRKGGCGNVQARVMPRGGGHRQGHFSLLHRPRAAWHLGAVVRSGLQALLGRLHVAFVSLVPCFDPTEAVPSGGSAAPDLSSLLCAPMAKHLPTRLGK